MSLCFDDGSKDNYQIDTIRKLPRHAAVPAVQGETDPNGIQPGEPGAKLDAGKVRAAQLLGQFSRALSAVAEVGEFGANKYVLGGWQEVSDGINRYENAQLRHWLKRQSGELNDSDSQLLHKAHEAWNALASLELYLRQ